MNTNNIYFIQVSAPTKANPNARKSYVVSSPYMTDAIIYIQDFWCRDGEEVVSTEKVKYMVDIDDTREGQTYIKIKA